MDYSPQSPLTCIDAFHSSSGRLSICQRQVEREGDKVVGFNQWERIKSSVTLAKGDGKEKVKNCQQSCQTPQLPVCGVCAGDVVVQRNVGKKNISDLFFVNHDT